MCNEVGSVVRHLNWVNNATENTGLSLLQQSLILFRPSAGYLMSVLKWLTLWQAHFAYGLGHTQILNKIPNRSHISPWTMLKKMNVVNGFFRST